MSGGRGRYVRWLILLLVLQTGLALAAIAIVRSEASALPAPPDPAAIDLPIPEMALTILSGVERAGPIARDWNTGARLSFASLQIDWSPTPPPETVTSLSPFGWLRLVYVAPVDGAASDYAALTLLFERVSGALIEARVSPWHVGPPETDLLAAVVVTDDTAVLAAEIAGGTAFRAACPERRSHTGVSLSIDPLSSEPVWNVAYRERGRGADGTMRIAVNASDGAVTIARSGPVGCVG